MKSLVRLLGWLLILGGIVGGIVGAVLVATDRVSSGWLTALYIVAPAILVIIIGRAMTRVGRRRTDANSEEWTRKGPPKQ